MLEIFWCSLVDQLGESLSIPKLVVKTYLRWALLPAQCSHLLKGTVGNPLFQQAASSPLTNKAYPCLGPDVVPSPFCKYRSTTLNNHKNNPVILTSVLKFHIGFDRIMFFSKEVLCPWFSASSAKQHTDLGVGRNCAWWPGEQSSCAGKSHGTGLLSEGQNLSPSQTEGKNQMCHLGAWKGSRDELKLHCIGSI